MRRGCPSFAVVPKGKIPSLGVALQQELYHGRLTQRGGGEPLPQKWEAAGGRGAM